MSASLLESFPTPSPSAARADLISLARQGESSNAHQVAPAEPQPHHSPAEYPQSMIQPQLDEALPLPQNDPRSARVLIVDDEQPMRAMARVIIESLGIDALEASTGEEAISLYRSHAAAGTPIDLVIMDLALPGGMSGLEASRSLMDFDPNAAIMISSGYLNQHSRQPALKQGFAGVLPKPYTIDRLSAEIHFILHRRNQNVSDE